MGKARHSYEFDEAEEAEEALRRAGRALGAGPKGKDALLKVLKVRAWGPASGLCDACTPRWA